MILKAVEAYSWCLEYPRRSASLPGLCAVRGPAAAAALRGGRMPDAFQRKIKQLGFPEVDCVEVRHLELDGVPAVYFESLPLRLRRAASFRPAPAWSSRTKLTVAGQRERHRHERNGAARAMARLANEPPRPTLNEHPRQRTRCASREIGSVVSMINRQAPRWRRAPSCRARRRARRVSRQPVRRMVSRQASRHGTVGPSAHARPSR